MIALLSCPCVPVGKIKCSGTTGQKYQVGQILRKLNDGDWMIKVALIETGEKAERRLSQIQSDVEAH